MAKEILEFELKADTSDFTKKMNSAKLLARDNKKEIDKNVVVNMELNIADLQSKLKIARDLLRKSIKDGDREAEIKLRLEVNRFTRDLRETNRELNNLLNTGDSSLSRLQTKFNQVSGSLQQSFLSLGGVIAGVFSFDKFLGTSDIFGGMQNALKQVAEGKELDILQKKILDTANNARVPVDSLTKSFVRFDLVNRQLGGTQDETLKILDSLSKGLTLSGATAQESSSAILQLSQAFGSGTLQGDEFRSVAENLPMVLDILAKKLGVPRGELKDLASEGKITSQVLKEALIEANEEISKNFDNTSLTIGQALTKIRNDFIIKFGEIDKNAGLTSSIISILQSTSNAFLFAINKTIEYGNVLKELGKIILSIIGAYGLLGLANILKTLPSYFATVTLATNSTTTAMGLLSRALLGLRALLGPLNLIFIGLSAVIYGGIKAYESYKNSIDTTVQSVNLLNEELSKNIKNQSDLDLMYRSGKISIDEYKKKSGELKKQQEILNLSVEQGKGKVFDYNQAINTLANSNYAPNTDGYIKERDEIIKNIEASIKLLEAKKALGITEINEKRNRDISKQQGTLKPVTGEGALLGESNTLKDLQQFNVNLGKINNEYKKKTSDFLTPIEKEIQDKKTQIENIDKLIEQLRRPTTLNNNFGGVGSSGTSKKIKEENEAEKEAKKLLEEKKKKVEELGKTNEKVYNEINKDIEDGITAMEKYVDEIEKVNKKIEDLKTDATSNIRDINNELLELGKKGTIDVGDRFIKVGEEIQATKDKLQELKDKGVSLNLAESIGLETLQKIPKTSLFGDTSVGDLIEILKVQNDLNKLLEEQRLGQTKLTEEEIKQAQIRSETNPTEKLLQEQEAEKKILEERRAIYEAIANGEKIQLDTIADYKNLKLAEELTLKQTALETELKTLTDNLELQRVALLKINEDKKKFEADWTKFFGTEIQKQKNYAKQLQDELLRIIALQKEAGLQGIQIGTPATAEQEAKIQGNVDNSKKVDIKIEANNNVDIDYAVQKISETVK